MSRHRTISDEKLLAAARSVFISGGPRASTRAIAQRAGVSEGVLFQRFGTKNGLFFAAMVPPAADLGEGPKAAYSLDEARRRVEALVLRLVDYFRRTVPVLGPLLTHPDFDFEEFARRHPESSLVALRRDLTRRLAEEQELGHIGRAETGPLALVLISLAHTIAVFERLGAHGSHFPESFIRKAVAELWNGISPGSRESKAAAARKPTPSR